MKICGLRTPLVYFLMALINLGLSIFLCQKYGAIGSAIGTALSFVLANGVAMNIYYHQKCNIDVLLFWKNILKMSRGFILPILCGGLIVYFVNLYSIFNLISCVCIYAFVYGTSMWFFGINKYEKNLICKPLVKIFKRKK